LFGVAIATENQEIFHFFPLFCLLRLLLNAHLPPITLLGISVLLDVTKRLQKPGAGLTPNCEGQDILLIIHNGF